MAPVRGLMEEFDFTAVLFWVIFIVNLEHTPTGRLACRRKSVRLGSDLGLSDTSWDGS